MFYRNKKTVVIGGGNSAAADALLLSHLCKQVTIIHRRDTLRATKIYHKPLMTAANVDFFWNCTPTEFLHGEQTNTIRLRNTQTGEQSTLDCDGIFVSIGRKPSTELVKGQLTLDPAGYIMADETTRTNIPGVFAVGDVRAKAVRQIVTAVADGAQAIHYAEEYLADIL
jgi:thioredoxin reductase (NADPH)